jgi:hypothetical protein
VPLEEAAERYAIDIRNAANTATLRTISSTSPVTTYTAAEQPPTSARRRRRSARIQQISDTVGRGAARKVVL